MIIHILIPHFWIAVEEQRRPDLRDRPVIIGSSFLKKSAARSAVLMANLLAEDFGVHSGMALSHARQICPEGVILSPELPLYRGVWDEVMALLLTYTPLVESLDPGEAVCDVTGCERLFGEPVPLAREITRQIEATTGLPAIGGVGSNRLVAQFAAKSIDPSSSIQSSCYDEWSGLQVASIEPGREADFLAPLPVTSLPEIDPQTLLAFQVLGLKTIGHLALISEAALESRFGQTGRRLARHSRGRDDRPVVAAPEAPSLSVCRPCDGGIDGNDPHPEDARALSQLVEGLASDLSRALKKEHRAGRLVTLLLRMPRPSPGSKFAVQDVAPSHSILPHPFAMLIAQPLGVQAARRFGSPGRLQGADSSAHSLSETASWGQDPRIHSMLPQPPRPNGSRPKPRLKASNPDHELNSGSEHPEPATTVKAMARMATNRPVDDTRTLTELAGRLLLRLLSTSGAKDMLAEPGAELQLEMRHFAPPEQMTLPGLDGRPVDARLPRLHRQEGILTSRFGATPFRHLTTIDLESTLSERRFRWGDGIAK